MSVKLLLSVGDGESGTVLDLSAYFVEQGLSAPPPAMGARTRAVEVRLDLDGASATALWTLWGTIEKKIEQARRAAGAYGVGTSVTLSVQLDTASWVYFDVLDGSLALEQFGILLDQAIGVLSLVCLPYARGDAITATLDPATTRTNGDGMSWLIANIPGDAPALARVTLADVSTGGVVINGVRLGARSLHGLASGDFDGILNLTATGAGVSASEANTVGGSLATMTPGSDWQTIASVSKPAAQYTSGLYDVYLRCRDHAFLVGTPSNLTFSVNPTPISPRYQSSGTGTDASAEVSIFLPPLADRILTLALGISGNVTPTTPAGWTLRDSQVNGTACGAYLYDRIADGSEASVSVTLSGAPTEWGLAYTEWRSLDYTTAADKTVKATGTSTTPSSGNTAVLAQSYELVLGVIATAAASATPGAGYTELFDNGSLVYEYKLVTATTAVSATATIASAAWAALCVTYRAELHGVATTTVPNLAAGSYQVKVTALNASGVESAALGPIVAAPAANGGVVLAWDAPASGTVSQYRVYWNRGSGWFYRDSGDDVAQMVLWTETSATAGDPPTTSPGDAGEAAAFRARAGLASGTTLFDGPLTLATISNTQWELLYLGTLPLPPQPALDGSAAQNWYLAIQAKSTADAPAAVDVDAVWLFPHDEPQTYAYVAGRELATLRDWMLDARRDGILTGHLRVSGTATDAGQLVTDDSPFLLGPGAAQVIAHVEIAGGVSDVTDAKLNPTVRLIPRFRLLRGAA